MQEMFVFYEPRPNTTMRVFSAFFTANRGAFLATGLGLAAAYVLAELLPAQLRELFATQMILGAALTFALATFTLRKMPAALSKKTASIGLIQLLAFFALVMPLPSQAQTATPCKSMADPCAIVGTGARVLVNPTGHKQVYKTIYITGKTADGKYNVYNVVGDIDDFNFKAGNLQYSDSEMLKYLDGVDAKDVGKTIQCEAICKNKAGEVVGVHPAQKAIVTGKRK